MRSIVPAAVLGLAILLGASCTREQAPPVVSRITAGEDNLAVRDGATTEAPRSDIAMGVRILPEIAGAGTRLQLSATGFSLDDGQIEWKVNGDLAPGMHTDSFPTEEYRKGTSVQVRVKVGERQVPSNIVTLVNSPPEIRSVRIVPDPIRPGDSIGVDVSGSDRDGDDVTFEYRWEKNGQPAGTGRRLEGTLRRNDSVSVRITPYDGEVRGNFLVVRREVKNYPPSIEGMVDARLADGVYTGTVRATDGDGDPLAYALMDAPPGMTIDPGTGAIRWTLPEGFLGKAAVTVSVTDGHGGEATYPFSLKIREESPQESPGEPSK